MGSDDYKKRGYGKNQYTIILIKTQSKRKLRLSLSKKYLIKDQYKHFFKDSYGR